jgi:hypothetical protein
MSNSNTELVRKYFNSALFNIIEIKEPFLSLTMPLRFSETSYQQSSGIERES